MNEGIQLEHVEVLRLEPHDVLVYHHSGRLNSEAIANISDLLRGYFPDHRIAVLEEGASFQVLRPEEDA